ncbi:MAG: HypC/HybG/HupF family hydrogenase formation chaperone [Magnetococcales bacterium]|nr:HypC/HybG/HupF family hydrogenase formation chaperone [Magnetococcales bacterium]
MCLGIPMKIIEIDGVEARCAMRGVEREVSLALLSDAPPQVGEYVIVHVGYAIQTMSEAEAETTWELLDEALSVTIELPDSDAEPGQPESVPSS